MNYLEILAYGSASNKRINQLKYGMGISKKKKNRILSPVKVEAPWFHLHEDDLP